MLVAQRSHAFHKALLCREYSALALYRFKYHSAHIIVHKSLN